MVTWRYSEKCSAGKETWSVIKAPCIKPLSEINNLSSKFLAPRRMDFKRQWIRSLAMSRARNRPFLNQGHLERQQSAKQITGRKWRRLAFFNFLRKFQLHSKNSDSLKPWTLVFKGQHEDVSLDTLCLRSLGWAPLAWDEMHAADGHDLLSLLTKGAINRKTRENSSERRNLLAAPRKGGGEIRQLGNPIAINVLLTRGERASVLFSQKQMRWSSKHEHRCVFAATRYSPNSKAVASRMKRYMKKFKETRKDRKAESERKGEDMGNPTGNNDHNMAPEYEKLHCTHKVETRSAQKIMSKKQWTSRKASWVHSNPRKFHKCSVNWCPCN